MPLCLIYSYLIKLTDYFQLLCNFCHLKNLKIKLNNVILESSFLEFCENLNMYCHGYMRFKCFKNVNTLLSAYRFYQHKTKYLL